LISSSESPSKFSSIASEPLRASHSRRQPKDHVPRPPNAFLMFRSEFWAREKQKEKPIDRNHRNISRIVSHCWNSMGNEEKARYQALAQERKQLHRLEHPNYKYAPANRTSKPAKKKPKKESNKGDEQEKDNCRRLAALVMDSISSNTQKVQKDTKKGPKNRHSKVHQSPPRSCRRAFNTAPLPEVCSSTQELVQGVHLEFSQEKSVDTFLMEGFVPTNKIPHLDLSAAKDEQVRNRPFFCLILTKKNYRSSF
jgi:HMG (high mobility group) box